MSDNPLYAELDRLRIELAASKAVVARLEEQRAKAEERAREIEADCAGMRRALRAWRAWCLDERHSVADDTQLFEQAIELMDDALGTKEAQDAGAD